MDEDDELHLDLHRAADELGKFATRMHVHTHEPISKERAKEFLRTLLVTVTTDCMNHGADMIGHVKSFIKASSGTLMGSLVDLSVGVVITDGMEDEPIDEMDVILHVIVHGIWDPVVRDVSMSSISEVCRDFDAEFDIVQDYYETEKSISHHVKK
jgi:hypothetical protein